MNQQRPFLKITKDSAGVTSTLKDDYVQEARLEDLSGEQSDALELELLLPPGAEWPEFGEEFECKIGYAGDDDEPLKYVQRGRYTVDQMALEGPPNLLRVSATSANFSSAVRAPKERSFNQRTLFSIVEEIAGEHDFDVHFEPASLGEVLVDHVDQTGESDLQFVHDLAETYGAMFKPVDGKWVMVSYERPTEAVAVIRPEDVSRFRTHHISRRVYRSVKAFYQDLEKANRVAVVVGDGEPQLVLPTPTVRQETAEAKARAALIKSRRESRQASITMPGRPDLGSQEVVELRGFGGLADDLWRIKSNVHKQNKRGYTSRLELEGV